MNSSIKELLFSFPTNCPHSPNIIYTNLKTIFDQMVDMSTRFSLANEIAKLDKLDGTQFHCWKGNMYFFVALKLAHVLNEKNPEKRWLQI